MNTSVIRFKSLDTNKLNIDYLYYFFKSNNYRNQISKLMTGIAQLNYGPYHLHKVQFPVCSIETQNERISVLNQLSDVIKNKKNELKKLNELIKSRFMCQEVAA